MSIPFPASSADPVIFEPIGIEYIWDHKFDKKPGTKHQCKACGQIRFHPNHGAPSYNSLIDRPPFVRNEAKQNWQRDVWQRLLTEAEMPVCERVFVEGEITFHDGRDRDQGNYRYFMEKCLGDALQKGGWIDNDKWGCFEFGRLLRTEPEPGLQRIRLTLFPS